MADPIKIKHFRLDGSYYTTTWTITSLFCPSCGCKPVWEDDCDDYYLGTHYLCVACGSTFNMPTLSDMRQNDKRAETLEALKAAGAGE